MDDAWSTQQAARLGAQVKQVEKADFKEWDWTTLAIWLRREKRLKAEGGNSTLQQRLRDLRRLSAGCEECADRGEAGAFNGADDGRPC
jgi:hypothetical protein